MTYKNFVYNVFKNHIQLYPLNLNYKYCFGLLSGIFLVLQYLTNLSTITYYISWFMDFFSFFFVLNISSSKALVLYDAEWLTARKRFYEELFYLRTNCWVPLFAIFCGILNIFLSFILFFFGKFEHIESEFECPSTDLYNHLFQGEAPNEILIYFAGYYLIFFGISAILIPFINRSFKLAFKKLFFLCIILLELVTVIWVYLVVSEKKTIFDVWWTKYIPINYWYGDGVSLSVSYITLSFFLVAFSYFFIALIFIYNICFKKSKILSFFAIIRSCFLFLFACFIMFSMSWNFIYMGALLCSYNERLKLLSYSSDLNSRYVWCDKIIFNIYYSETFNYFMAFVIIMFLLKNQLLKIKYKNYWKLIIGLMFSWFLLVFGNLFLWIVLEQWLEISFINKFYIRVFYFFFCFILLFFCLIKYIILKIKLNSVVVSIIMFLIIFFLWSYCTFCDILSLKYLAWSSISNYVDFENIFYSHTLSYQGIRLFKIIPFWPILGFFHWYIGYFSKLKLNKVFVIVEFCFLIWPCLVSFIFVLKVVTKNMYNPSVFTIWQYASEVVNLNFSLGDKYWLNLCRSSFLWILIGFIWLFLTIFFTYMYNNLKKK